ncbi:MAG: sodium-translocating pyrophosphatase [Nitrososphaerota archaeon]
MLIAALGVAASAGFVYAVERRPKGSESMAYVWQGIREGSRAYLRRQYRSVAIIAGVLFFLILGSFAAYPSLGGAAYGLKVAGSFALGVAFSLIAAYIAMDAATRANVRCTAAAEQGTAQALRVAILGGAALGLAVLAMSLLGLSILYAVFRDPGVLAGFGFGASLAALFAQLGGGIYTKSADIGADLVGKVEAGIPEDDPRNPAVIADQVGDNVGDEAGRGADLFESVTAENLGGMIVGLVLSIALFGAIGESYVLLPLAVTSLGILATFAGVAWALGQRSFKEPIEPLRNGLIVATVALALMLLPVSYGVVGTAGLWLYGAMLVGLMAGLLITFYSEFYTGLRSSYVQRIAKNSEAGPALTVMSGLSAGLVSSAVPIITLVVAIALSFLAGQRWAAEAHLGNMLLGGIYGTTMATMGLLAIAGMVLTMDGVGPIVDNAGGIAELSNAPDELRARLEPLDALGNTTKALTKSYAMGSATLAALLLFQAFLLEVARYKAGIVELTLLTPSQAQQLISAVSQLGQQLQINTPSLLIGLLVGAVLPFFFSGQAIGAVALGAHQMVEEVRRQFREIPGLLDGSGRPDYARCVDISTKTALRLMVTPTLTLTLAPIVLGVALGWQAVGALVIGATAAAIPLAILGFYGGAAMDNAKKFLEIQGKKGTDAHKAAVIGDTVGDPMKDTYAPSLHILVKLLNTLSLVFIPLFLAPLLAL